MNSMLPGSNWPGSQKLTPPSSATDIVDAAANSSPAHTDFLRLAAVMIRQLVARGEKTQSLHQLDLTGPPRLLEPRLQRAVEAKHGVEAFAWNGLDPVRFMAFASSPFFVSLHQLRFAE